MKLIFTLITVSALLFSCAENSPSYSEVIKSQRKSKDIQFKGINSPIPDDLKNDFEALNYYAPDSAFLIKARVEWDFSVNQSQLYKNKREDSQHYPIAKLLFELNGKKMVLQGFANERKIPQSLFVPFYDETSGNETYGGGRYVDVQILKKKEVEIDFNKAYNPYCVYNSNYVCAIPPFENDLKTKILAGEKLPLIDEPVH